MAAIHHHLPVEELIAGRPVVHNLTETHVSDVVTETVSGAVGFFTTPVTGARKGGSAAVHACMRTVLAAHQIDNLGCHDLCHG